MTTNIMSAEQFRDLCHEVQDLRANLDSCLDTEAPVVAERLIGRVQQLRSATTKRSSRTLFELRDKVIYSAMLSHARRSE